MIEKELLEGPFGRGIEVQYFQDNDRRLVEELVREKSGLTSI